MMPVIAWNALHASTILATRWTGARDALRRRHRGRRSALPRAARSQHRGGDGSESVHRIREDGGDRERVGEDGQADSRDRARARPARCAGSSIAILSAEAMTTPGIAGREKAK